MKRVVAYINKATSPIPLIVFRVCFGLIMLVSLLRFMANGWIHQLYIEPTIFFPFFDWVKPLPGWGMYVLFVVMILAAIGIAVGLFYRLSCALFFSIFTYIELIDKANYLNHYYFVSIIAFILIWLPAHCQYSLDLKLFPKIYRPSLPRWMVGVIRLQLGMVYFFAGLAKINPHWLFEAMPLKIWLPSRVDLPIIGTLFKYPMAAFAFSWAGAFYDLLIPIFLLIKRTRTWAYVAVIIFHLLTAMLFQIGMFPYIMILSTLIFFSGDQLKNKLGWVLKHLQAIPNITFNTQPIKPYVLQAFFLVFFLVQIILPFRYLWQEGNLYWNERGYRFSWRVMLMEKAGMVQFKVHDAINPALQEEVCNVNYLTPHQEKMMATQPDMILQFAQFLKKEYKNKGIEPVITVDAYVSLNGKGSRRFVKEGIDLALINSNTPHNQWITKYNVYEN